MSQMTDAESCTRTCWIVAAILGLLFAILLIAAADWGWFGGILAGLILAVFMGLLLKYFFCTGDNAASGTSAGTGAASGTAAAASGGTSDADARARSTGAVAPASAGREATTTADAASNAAVAASTSNAAAAADTSGAPDSDGPKVKPSTPLAGEAELAERKGNWKYEGDGDAVSDEAAGSTDAGDANAAAAEATAAPAAASAGADAAAEAQPETLSGPRGTADDLKRISGVGPKLEGVLNELGFWHFWQIAQWGPEEVAWVDSRLKFKGRIERDNWIAQARAFSEGQEL